MSEVATIVGGGPAVEYRDIPGFPGYRVGSDGSVWTARQKVALGGRNGTRAIVGDAWRKMTPSPRNKEGHLCVVLSDKKSYHVHYLVLLTFVGPRPEGMECCHSPDRNPANNALSNLRWGTRKSNAADTLEHDTMVYGERNGQAKLTAERVAEMRSDYAAGASQASLARKYKVSKTTARRVVTGRSWVRQLKA